MRAADFVTDEFVVAMIEIMKKTAKDENFKANVVLQACKYVYLNKYTAPGRRAESCGEWSFCPD